MYIKHDSLISNYLSIIKYASETSDTFSFITMQNKPFSKRPPVCVHDEYLERLKPFLKSQEIGIQKWPNTITGDRHKVMNVYKSCKETKKILQEYGNPFIFCVEMPEDICFYRNGKPWFVTTSHERIAYLEQTTSNDIKFFENWFALKLSEVFK